MKKGNKENKGGWDKSAGKGVGDYLKTFREVKGCRRQEIYDGICSAATFSRIEAGEKNVDFLMLEALLSRMKIDEGECEFILEDSDYDAYRQREEIEIHVKNRAYEQAEKCMAAYEERYGTGKLEGQFLAFQRALLEKTKPQWEREKVSELFLEALMVTAPEYRNQFELKETLSNRELLCIAEILYCMEDPVRQEEEFEKLYGYFTYNCRREGFLPLSYYTAMQYYGECLYRNGKYEKCIRICDEVLKELIHTSKAENRAELFFLRAKARERKGIKTEDEKEMCLKDLLTAYYTASFYAEDERTEALRQYIGGKYGWQFID